MEYTVPVRRELVVPEFTRLAYRQGAGIDRPGGRVKSRRSGYRREQITSPDTAELIAFGVQQPGNNRINLDPGLSGKEDVEQRGVGAIRGQDRETGHNESSRRKAATLARALVIQKEKAVTAFAPDRTAQAPAEDILLDRGARLVVAVEEEVIGIQH